MPTAQQLRERLVGLLTELFQLNQPDLDFGFWRIMHAKAREVTEFLRTDLLGIVAETFGRDSAARMAELQKAYEDAVARAKEYDAPDPEQAEPVKQAKAALNAAADTSRAEGEVYDHLYRFFERYYADGDFLSRRYYARETPGKAAPYAIPYDGSEIYLHWANKDQYYVKTSEYFTNFTFDPTRAPEVLGAKDALLAGHDLPPLKVEFRIVAATEGEHGNVKPGAEQKRFFILHEPQPVYFEDGRLVVGFEFRSDPEKTGQDRTWQEKRCAEAVQKVLAALDDLATGARQVEEADATLAGRPVADLAREYAAVLRAPAPTAKQKDRPLLAKYVAKYVARNTMDYFIHKDLGSFLRRELDFYLKNEVMRLDDIESADAARAERYLDQVRVLRRIAHKIIAFLAQLEDFQKRLWLKKKFVVETNYCVTVGQIAGTFHAEIAACEAQWQEWKDLFHIDEEQQDLFSATANCMKDPRIAFLKTHPTLVLDTKHFDQDFHDRLLVSFGDLDERTNGLLIHGENFQVLNLLLGKYRRKIECVYIDPPYNTGDSEILYKNEYLLSSWLTLMENRLAISEQMLAEDPVLFVAIDDFEMADLCALIDRRFPFLRREMIVVNHHPQGGKAKTLANTHEYMLACVSRASDRTLTGRESTDGVEHRPFKRSGTAESNFRYGRPNSFYALLVDPESKAVVGADHPPNVADKYPRENTSSGLVRVYPLGSEGEERVWRRSYESCLPLIAERKLMCSDKMTIYQLIEAHDRTAALFSNWVGARYNAGIYGANLLRDIIGEQNPFSYPKSIHTVADAVFSCDIGDGGVCLDYFAGSGTMGHAVINLNREDDGNRKFIMAEIGDYFNTVLLPRIKKITFSPEWKEGKPVRQATAEEAERSPRIVKVVRLESYEDALNNLAEPAPTAEQAKVLAENPALREDYTLHYMLDVETKGSPSLLSIDAFTDPTAYRLKVKRPGTDEYEERPVDLLETFNYLLGLRVEHLAAPQTFTAEFERPADPELPEDQRTRLTLKGKLRQDAAGPWWFRKVEGWLPRDRENPNGPDHEKILIVWRKLTGDLERDNLVLDEWFETNRINTRDWEFDTIYVNGSNNLPNLQREGDTWKVRLIEEDFHRLMWDVEDV